MTTAAKTNVHRKLSQARQKFHTLKLTKTGKNTFAGYSYFELGDFLIPALGVFDEVGLGGIVSFDADLAIMRITDLDNPLDTIVITSPMGSAALKGCHEVQNIGAVETYQRRYLWVAALEIVEHDALDATTGDAGSTANPTTGETPPAKRVPLDGPYTSKTALWAAVRTFVSTANGCGDQGEWIGCRDCDETKELLAQCERDAPGLLRDGIPDLPEYEPLEIFIARKNHEMEELESIANSPGAKLLAAG